jgi:hypothetical protein
METTRYIFATRNDLIPGLQRIESKRTLRYSTAKWQRSAHFSIYRSALDIATLGISVSGDVIGSAEYWAMNEGAPLDVRAIPQEDGGTYYESFCRSAVLFDHGGLYMQRCLIPGMIHSPGLIEGIDLYKDFSKEVALGFTKVYRFWVGPEALELLKSGFRLATGNAEAGPEEDLRPSMIPEKKR